MSDIICKTHQVSEDRQRRKYSPDKKKKKIHYREVLLRAFCLSSPVLVLHFQASRSSSEVRSGLDLRSEAGQTELAGKLLEGSLWRRGKRSDFKSVARHVAFQRPCPRPTSRLPQSAYGWMESSTGVRLHWGGGGGIMSYGIEGGGEKDVTRKRTPCSAFMCKLKWLFVQSTNNSTTFKRVDFLRDFLSIIFYFQIAVKRLFKQNFLHYIGKIKWRYLSI